MVKQTLLNSKTQGSVVQIHISNFHVLVLIDLSLRGYHIAAIMSENK